MHSPRESLSDPARLASLRRAALLDTPAEESFDRLTRFAAKLLDVPVALISLVDETRQFFKSQCGLPEPWASRRETPLSHSLCQHVVTSAKPLMIERTREHARVNGSLAIRDLGVEAYLGVPIQSAGGHVLGSLCVIDHSPRQWTNEELDTLSGLATSVVTEIELRMARADLEQRAEKAGEARHWERYFRALVENISDAVTVLGPDGSVKYVSPAFERITGYSAEERARQSAFERVHPDDLGAVQHAFRQLNRDPGAQVAIEARLHDREGRWRVVTLVGRNLLADPDVGGIVVTYSDVTERRRAEAALERERLYFERLFESNPEGVALVDPEDRVLRVNPAFTRLFGYSRSEAVGRYISDLIVPKGSEEEALSLTQRITKGETVEHDTVRQNKDGTDVDVCVVGTPVRLHGDQVAAYGIYRDLRQRKTLERELRRIGITDELTGLLNRRGFLRDAERMWTLAHRGGEDVLVLYADLDGLKQINDEYGHAEGDRALQDTADLLRQCFRSTDVIGRLGGDEFVVLAVDADHDAEALLAGRLQEAIQRHNETSEHLYSLALSVGCFRTPARETHSLEQLLAGADRRMYEEKRARRNALANPGSS